MTLVDEHASAVGVTDACRTLGVSRATWYRRRARRDGVPPWPQSRSHPRRLSDAERACVLEVLCSDEFIDRAPREVYGVPFHLSADLQSEARQRDACAADAGISEEGPCSGPVN
jgi:putative transposase